MIVDVKLIPLSPGIYFFWDKNRKILYIGKACNLRTRINQHLQAHLDFSSLLSNMDKLKDLTVEQLESLNWKIINTFMRQPIDVLFGEVNEITYKIVEMKEKKNMGKIEMEYIKNMSPPFNWHTCTKKYSDEQERLFDAIKKLHIEIYYRKCGGDLVEDMKKMEIESQRKFLEKMF